ncbi:Conserved hypothetical protein, predicted membrane protein [Mycoplasma mycoides subsp. capri LC str. 95010]|uniref:Uncharacterized protein n=1 Tax=Mycoplasma mycoides subsp. capri LC str. 95010 TaxID=862259 RepID=F4MQF2_MYCML|nr:hypothetical protein [Mycoplasma mycoides]CBW54335.1 Conserved hypothetical protein, predicted membrane protein [Mycoplasma mycoides subsp. capri LC str. 95010]
MILKTKIILISVISSLVLISISGFVGYKIGSTNNVEYKNRNKRLLKIIGFDRFNSSDDWIEFKNTNENEQKHKKASKYNGEFRKRKDEILLIKDNIYNISSNIDSKYKIKKTITFFYNKDNNIYKYIISNFFYDEKDVVSFLTSKFKDSRDTFDVRNATITKIKVE